MESYYDRVTETKRKLFIDRYCLWCFILEGVREIPPTNIFPPTPPRDLVNEHNYCVNRSKSITLIYGEKYIVSYTARE